MEWLKNGCFWDSRDMVRFTGGAVWGVESHSMATYAEIAECVKRQSGFTPKTCWIAHVKELNGRKR